MIFDYILILFFPSIVIIGVTIFLIKAPRKEKLIRPLRSQKVLFGFLILWTLLGFFTQQDFTERCGCLVHSRDIFSLDYIILSAISLILLILGFSIRNKFVRISILWLELAYWIFKLFALKSGYEGGLGILVFNYYDFLGLLGRFLLINSLLGYRFKEYILPLVVGVIIIIKMFGVPCNENFIYRDYLNPYYNRLFFNQINGNWTGSMLYPNDSIIEETIKNPDHIIYGSKPEINLYRDTILYSRFDSVYLTFNDSSLSIEKSSPELNGQYCLTYSRPESNYFVYLPCHYIDDAERDYHFNQYSITIFFENISDSTISCYIDNRIELILKNCR
jgi:hypothetical protein